VRVGIFVRDRVNEKELYERKRRAGSGHVPLSAAGTAYWVTTNPFEPAIGIFRASEEKITERDGRYAWLARGRQIIERPVPTCNSRYRFRRCFVVFIVIIISYGVWNVSLFTVEVSLRLKI